MIFYTLPNIQSTNNRAKAKDCLRSIEWYVFRRSRLSGYDWLKGDYRTTLQRFSEYAGKCNEITVAMALARIVENCDDITACEVIRQANTKIYSLNSGLEDQAKLR